MQLNGLMVVNIVFKLKHFMMKFFYTLSFYVLFMTSAKTQVIKMDDLNFLINDWKGTLTYIDYKSGNPYTMPANMSFKKLNSNELLAQHIYPDEPKANSIDTFVISNSGKFFNENKIIKVVHLSNNGIEITTQTKGKDGNDNKPALLKHIYTITKDSFINRKEVKFLDEKKWMLRNEYKFSN